MEDWQMMAAVAGIALAAVSLFVGWVYLLFRILRDEMRTMRQELLDRMDRNHREVLTLLQHHTHGEDGRPVFHQLPDVTPG